MKMRLYAFAVSPDRKNYFSCFQCLILYKVLISMTLSDYFTFINIIEAVKA